MRLIDADATMDKLEALAKRYAEQGKDGIAQDYNWVCTILIATPTADVAPVVHAHWIRTNSGKWRCSRCRGRHDRPKRYCGECGARMNEKKGGDDND